MQVLTVLDVSLSDATPCVRIFAAVMALAKNFEGYAVFARLMGDESHESKELIKELKVIEVILFSNQKSQCSEWVLCVKKLRTRSSSETLA